MKERFEALLARLPEDVDAVMIMSQVGRRYFLGMHCTAGTLLLVKNAGTYLIIDSRYIEKARACAKGCQVLLQDNLYDQLNGLISKHGIHTIGIETGYLTVGTFLELKEKLKATLLMDSRVSKEIETLRKFKSPMELDAIRAAQKITDNAFSHILGYIRPGITERDVARELLDQCLRGGAEGPSFDFISVSGKNSSLPHGVPSDKLLEKGEFLTMDFGCVVDGYCSDMTRTVAIGQITDEMKLVYETVLKSQLAAIEAVKPGASCKAVDFAAKNAIYEVFGPDYPGCFSHGTGHSLGVEIHESPAFKPLDDSCCEPGIVMTVEPGIYLEGRFGVRIEDMVLVTADGYENLTASQKQLIVL